MVAQGGKKRGRGRLVEAGTTHAHGGVERDDAVCATAVPPAPPRFPPVLPVPGCMGGGAGGGDEGEGECPPVGSKSAPARGACRLFRQRSFSFVSFVSILRHQRRLGEAKGFVGGGLCQGASRRGTSGGAQVRGTRGADRRGECHLPLCFHARASVRLRVARRLAVRHPHAGTVVSVARVDSALLSCVRRPPWRPTHGRGGRGGGVLVAVAHRRG